MDLGGVVVVGQVDVVGVGVCGVFGAPGVVRCEGEGGDGGAGLVPRGVGVCLRESTGS